MIEPKPASPKGIPIASVFGDLDVESETLGSICYTLLRRKDTPFILTATPCADTLVPGVIVAYEDKDEVTRG